MEPNSHNIETSHDRHSCAGKNLATSLHVVVAIHLNTAANQQAQLLQRHNMIAELTLQ